MAHQVQYGTRVPRTFLDRPRSLYQLLADSAAAFPDDPAVIEGAVATNYRDLDELARTFASALEAGGVRAGDRCAIFIENSLEFLIALYGCAACGVISIPIGARLRGDEVHYILDTADAKVLVYGRPVTDQLPGLDTLSSLDLVLEVAPERGGSFWSAIDAARPLDSACAVDEEDEAVLIFTSGTTGRPKGVILSHMGLIHSVLHFERTLGFLPRDRFILAVPGSHITGLAAVILEAAYLGGSVVLMRSFKADHFLDQIAAHGVNCSVLVPAMYNLILLQPDLDVRDLESWRVGIFGGAPMPSATIAELKRGLPGLVLVNGYGATETSSAISLSLPGMIDEKPDSVGMPVQCADILILDERDVEVPQGTVGQLHVAGPMVAKGYWNDPVATACEFVGGYWRSGDLASIDADGAIQLHGRIKDMINRGGYKVFPVEVENVIVQLPEVIECAVFGYDDPVLGEKIAAVIAVLEGADLDEQRLRAFCRRTIADYKCPDLFRITTELLPRNSNGKVDKAVAKAATIGRMPADCPDQDGG